ncbi:DUF4010 domain-containing protein [Candidatus Micrarchaeota archaeon]|nr:DUF4010 domain-containing protein [Candidatus Micrarchaeota archaeon]
MAGFIESLLISAAIGGIIGLEREHTKKQTIVGVRTFALVSLLGLLITELASQHSLIYAVVGLVGVFAITTSFYFFRATHFRHAIGLTTIVMIPISYLLGALVSFGFVIEAIAATVLITYVLVERGAVHRLVERISRREIIDGLVFGLIAFVLYPLVPREPYYIFNYPIDLQIFSLTVIIVSAVSFVSHVIMKFVHKRAILISSFLGGLVSSLATVVLFAKEKRLSFNAFLLSFSSSAAGSLTRNLILLAGVSPLLFQTSFPVFLVPLAFLLMVTAFFSSQVSLTNARYVFNKPISMRFVLEFAFVLFFITLVVNVISLQTSSILLFLSLAIGGVVSSASVIASIASLHASGTFSQSQAVIGLAIALIGSTVSNTIFVFRDHEPHHRLQLLFLVLVSVAVIILGFFASQYQLFGG